MDAYNATIKYLKDKYGIREAGYSPLFNARLRRLSGKQYHELIRNEGANNLVDSFNKPDDEDTELVLLLVQYYSGIEPKRDLINALINRGINENELTPVISRN